MKEQIGIMEPAAIGKCKYCKLKEHKSENCETAKLFKVAKNIQLEQDNTRRNFNNDTRQIECFKCNEMGHYANTRSNLATNNNFGSNRNGAPRFDNIYYDNNNESYNNNGREQRVNRNHNQTNNSEIRGSGRNQNYERPYTGYKNNNRSDDTRRPNGNTNPEMRDNENRPNSDRINATVENTERKFEIEGIPFFLEGDEDSDLN